MHDPILSNPTYQMACEQFDLAADFLKLSDSLRERTKWPKRIISVSFPVKMDNGLVKIFHGHRVQHHLAMGPTKGGLRYHPDVEVGEVIALAMWMSWKCSLAGLPYGGGKGGITCDPRTMSMGELERVTREFTKEMIPFISPEIDVMAPDMGTNPQTMAWMMDVYSVHVGHSTPSIVTGKPISVGGSQGRLESTGKGVAFCVERALTELKMPIGGSTAVVQGYGNVGSIAAKAMASSGIKVIALSDVSGAIYNENGIDFIKLDEYTKTSTTGIVGFPESQPIDPQAMLELKCDVLVPAAVERVITEHNARKLQCRILAEGANGPTTPQADKIIEERGDIFVVPDVLCNSGGVIVSYFEWVQGLQNFFWSNVEVYNKLYEIMGSAYTRVRKTAKEFNTSNRNAALILGVRRVVESKQIRGLFP
jgi:glutamate dehydrogenase (NAD(P)+)